MNKSICSLSAGLMSAMLLLVGCSRVSGDERVVFEKPTDVSALLESVRSVEFVPLETSDEVLIGDRSEMFLLDDGSFVVWDRGSREDGCPVLPADYGIYHFDSSGRFINNIGRPGSGEHEYSNVSSVQIVGDDIVVFSEKGRTLRFSAEGSLISEKQVEGLGVQSCLVPEGILTYHGFGAGSENRVEVIHEDGSVVGFLPTSAKVLILTPDTPVFSSDGGRVYFTDTYSPDIHVYENGTVRSAVSFDFGEAALSERFYQFEDAMAAAQYMLSSDQFALIQRYLPGKEYQFVEVFIQKGMEVESDYGFNRAGEGWKWFSMGSVSLSPFAGSLRCLDGDVLYCLLDAKRMTGEVDAQAARLVEKASNAEILDGLDAGDNPVVAKLCLK